MINLIKNKIKMLICGDEIDELWRLKQRISDVGVWCSSDKKAVAISEYLLDQTKYPSQLRGAHGSIEDFRSYLDKIV